MPANKGGNTGFYPRPFLGRGFFYVTGNIALKELIYCYKRFNLILGGFTIMTLYDELVARGLIAQVTNEEEIKKMVKNG